MNIDLRLKSSEEFFSDSPNYFLYHMRIAFNLSFSYGTYYFITCIIVLIKILFSSSRSVLSNRNIMEATYIILCLLVVTLKNKK